MYNKTNGEILVIVVAMLVMLILNLSVLALTAWVFQLTGSAWSFAILLFLFRANVKD